MAQLEPNIIALGWFVLFWSACCVGFFQLAGMYPLHTRDEPQSTPILLVLGNTALWLALLLGTCWFAYQELRWSTIIVVAGILFLFIPELVQAMPQRWRDGRPGLIASCFGLVVVLVLLGRVASFGLSLS